MRRIVRDKGQPIGSGRGDRPARRRDSEGPGGRARPPRRQLRRGGLAAKEEALRRGWHRFRAELPRGPVRGRAERAGTLTRWRSAWPAPPSARRSAGFWTSRLVEVGSDGVAGDAGGQDRPDRHDQRSWPECRNATRWTCYGGGRWRRSASTCSPARAFEGSITYAGAVVDPDSRTFAVELLLPNPGGRIKPEMIADIEMVLEEIAEAIVVPQQALVSMEEGHVVFVVEGDEASARAAAHRVEVSASQGNEVVVGLRAGGGKPSGGGRAAGADRRVTGYGSWAGARSPRVAGDQ